MDNNNLNIKIVYVCRTCTKEIINTSFFDLDFTQIDSEPTIGQKLSNCIPELDLSIIPNTMICGKCADTINSLYIFKKECIQFEMQICEYIQQPHHTDNVIDLAAVMQFHQLHSKNLPAGLTMEVFKTTEYKSEESSSSFCDNNDFNETEGYTEIANKEYLTSLQMVERHCVLFNTFDNFINFDKSESEEYSDTHDDSNIVQDCLLQVVENPDSCIQNLNKPDMPTHTDEQLFKCSICEGSYKYKRSLKNHMLTHTGEQPFKCSYCGYGFYQKNHLKMHVLIHTGEKPFRCSICEYSCRHKNSLQIHKLSHTGGNPFTCSVCEYSCKDKTSIKNHMLINHIGENLFKCSICESSCNDKNSLKIHMLAHNI